jgi:hypothetical protein
MVKGMREPYPDKARKWMARGQNALLRIFQPGPYLTRTVIRASIESSP